MLCLYNNIIIKAAGIQTTNVPINNVEFIYFLVLMVVESTMAVKQDHP